VLVNPTDPGNNATFSNSGSIGSPYYRTDVGAHEFSDSPYGTFDQGGNVWEWNDTVSGSSSSGRGSRGGAFYNGADRLASSYRSISTPTNESYYAGFRVASVPEPSVFAMLGLVGVAMAGYVWRRRKRVA
jgi:formylglycine-generating enzyme required for sulfatase activity